MAVVTIRFKYSPGETVFFVYREDVISSVVMQCMYGSCSPGSDHEKRYRLADHSEPWPEDCVWPTKDDAARAFARKIINE